MLYETEPFPRNGKSLTPLILLVEDDPDNAQLFLHILTQETSLRVFWATNGMAALHFTQHVKPQLFLLDYYLPDMNGIVLYDRLHVRKELEAVPALITGAYLEAAADDIKQRGLFALEKPFELDEFLSIIESIVAASSSMRRL
jgi:CheY-like chemotaxis protein